MYVQYRGSPANLVNGPGRSVSSSAMLNTHPLAARLLPTVPGLRLDGMTIGADEILLILVATAPQSPCPLCGHLARSVHSAYHRTLADLPWGQHAVRLHLVVRKFFCRTPACPRRVFTERLPALAAPYARRTTRLAEVLRLLAFALGGEAGGRLVARLCMAVSPATLLRLIRRTVLPARATPRLLGLDDWARRKGHRYGTILVDLERHGVIELLPDREVETVAQWLREHPGVHLVTRDRSDAYAEGVRRGAPAALQVADRFHLTKNLGDALERFFNRHRRLLRQVPRPVPDVAAAAGPVPRAPVRPAPLRPAAERARERTRANRQARHETIRARYQKGASIAQIARELRLNWKTVRKYAEADVCPQTPRYALRPRLLTRYEPYLRQRWDEGCHNGSRLYREVTAQGFTGSRILVAVFVAELRRQDSAGEHSPATVPETPQDHLRPHGAAMLVVRRPADCSAAEQQALDHLIGLAPEVARVVELSRRFLGLLRERQGSRACETWLADAVASGIPELRRFAIKLRQDEGAVRAACTEPHSNGQTEGQVNRLKLLKRQMYGRANFDLLRQRVLAA
jgi:transposase